MIKIIVIVLLAYMAWRALRADIVRRLNAQARQGQVETVDAVRCPQCGVYFAKGDTHRCVPRAD